MELNDIVEWRGNYYHLRAINDYNLSNGECKLQLLGPLLYDVTVAPLAPECAFDVIVGTGSIDPSPTPSISVSPSTTPSVTPSISTTPSMTATPSVTPTISVSPSQTPSMTPSPSAFSCADCRNWLWTNNTAFDVIYYYRCSDGALQTIVTESGQNGSFCNCNSVGQPYLQYDYVVLTESGVCPSPSVTPSMTATPSVTPSVTATTSIPVTPSRTPTPTPTISITPTRTPSISVTPTRTPSISVSPVPQTQNVLLESCIGPGDIIVTMAVNINATGTLVIGDVIFLSGGFAGYYCFTVTSVTTGTPTFSGTATSKFADCDCPEP